MARGCDGIQEVGGFFRDDRRRTLGFLKAGRRLKATLDDSSRMPRIGLRGTAKIYGEKVTLFYYLARRPLAAARQFLGL